MGEFDAAAEAFDQAIQLHLANGNRTYAAMTWLTLAELWIRQARLDLARSAWGAADELLAALPHPPAREVGRLQEMRGVVFQDLG